MSLFSDAVRIMRLFSVRGYMDFHHACRQHIRKVIQTIVRMEEQIDAKEKPVEVARTAAYLIAETMVLLSKAGIREEDFEQVWAAAMRDYDVCSFGSLAEVDLAKNEHHAHTRIPTKSAYSFSGRYFMWRKRGTNVIAPYGYEPDEMAYLNEKLEKMDYMQYFMDVVNKRTK